MGSGQTSETILIDKKKKTKQNLFKKKKKVVSAIPRGGDGVEVWLKSMTATSKSLQR